MCEKEGFIPRYYIDSPNDKVDWVIKDNQSYAKKLITEEMNLGDMLDRALKQIEEDKAKAEDEEVTGFEEELFSDLDEENNQLTDEDMIKFQEFEAELEKEDKKKMSKDFEKEEKKTIRRKEE